MSVDFGDISDIENVNDLSDMSIEGSAFDDLTHDTTRESMSNVGDLGLTNDSLDLSEINEQNISDVDMTTSPLNDTTAEGDVSFGGRRKRRTRKTRKSKKIRKGRGRKTMKGRKAQKTRKTRKGRKVKRRRNAQNTRRMRGGDVDSLGDSDFNPNLAFDKKAIGGAPVGQNCYDPNFSIYNTRSLQLFPYKP